MRGRAKFIRKSADTDDSMINRAYKAIKNQKSGESIVSAYAATAKPKTKASKVDKPHIDKSAPLKFGHYNKDTTTEAARKKELAGMSKPPAPARKPKVARKPKAAPKPKQRSGFDFGSAIARGFGGDEAWMREKRKAKVVDV